MSSSSLLTIRHLSKRFGPVTALRSVSLSLEKGRIYGLAGENGAGKSTLVKILCAVHSEYEGELFLDGVPYAPRNPSQAEQAGISVFHQEIPVCPNLSVAANLFLGPHLPTRSLFPDWKRMEERARQLFRDLLEVEIPPERLMRDCSVAQRQLALLARALSRNARLIVLDEPTTALGPPEVSRLCEVVRRLRSQGITFIFVSHILDQLIDLSDEIHVLRDGERVAHLERDQFESHLLAGLIAGRAFEDLRPVRSTVPAAPKLQVRGLSLAGHFRDVSFDLMPGEILGLAGLQGSGRSALVRSLFAAPPADEGEMILNGRSLRLISCRDAMRAGIGYVPEDRHNLGLFDDLDIQTNVGVARLDALGSCGFLSRRRLRELTLEMQGRLHIKMPATNAPVTSLSGGNQQKVLLSRWLAIRPEVLLMNEPTSGVDVGAKDDICRQIQNLAGEGYSFVLSSSDFDELLRLSDRILVLNHGRIAAELPRSQASKQKLIHAVGTNSQPAAHTNGS